MAVRLQDIADQLSVSKATVSRALRNHPDISKATCQRVQEKAKEMGYEPNYLAQALSTRKSFNIGLVIPHIAHNYFSEIMQGIYDVVDEAGFNIIVASSHESAEKEFSNIKKLVSKRVDGLLISASAETNNTEAFDYLKDKNIPFVLFDRKVAFKKTTKVSIDYKQLYDTKFAFYKKQGYKEVSILSNALNSFDGKERLNAIQEAAKNYKIKVPQENIIPCKSNEEGGVYAFHRLNFFGSFPPLIDTSTTQQALGIYKEAIRSGFSIPKHFALAGNYITNETESLETRITGVKINLQELGKKSAEILVKAINEKQDIKSKEILMPCELIERESTPVVDKK